MTADRLSDEISRAPTPTISVVVPALNVEATLRQQLAALAAQDFSGPWELIVVDNGSTDGTARVATSAADHRDCSVRVVSEPRRGLNIARNAGVAEASADKIAICDADDAVDPGWLRAMLEGLNEFDLVGGAMRTTRINTRSALELRGLSGSQGLGRSVGKGLGYLPQVIGANFGFTRAIWEQVGRFDERFQRGGGDVDFAWRAQLRGTTIGYRSDPMRSSITDSVRTSPQHSDSTSVTARGRLISSRTTEFRGCRGRRSPRRSDLGYGCSAVSTFFAGERPPNRGTCCASSENNGEGSRDPRDTGCSTHDPQ